MLVTRRFDKLVLKLLMFLRVSQENGALQLSY